MRTAIKIAEKEITQGDLDNGGKVTINGVPINTGANNPFVAEIVNPNNPTNPSEPIIGNIDVDSLVPDEPVDPETTRVPDKAKGMEFDEDANKDGRLTDAENRGGDNDTGTTTIIVTVPTDGNIKVGDKVVIRDEDGNKVAEKEITQGDPLIMAAK